MHCRVLLDALGGKRMTAWNGPLVGSASLDIDHILNGKESCSERETAQLQLLWGLRPPPTPKHRNRRELIEIYRLVGSNREIKVGTPPKHLWSC